LEAAIPPSKISALSSGEFVGMVADDPHQKIELKAFHCEILNDHEALKKEHEGYKEISVVRKLDNVMVQRNYLQIKQDVQDIIQSEMESMLNDPGLKHLVIKKGKEQ
jgi:TusA-related sulfurtransferase